MQYIFFALVTGSTLALAAVGFAFIRQTQGFLNIAHGQYMLVGALVAHLLSTTGALPLYVAVLVSCLFVGLFGLIVAHQVFLPLKDKGHLAQFFSSIGMAFIIYGLVLATWSGRAVKMLPSDSDYSVSVAPGLTMTTVEIAIVAVSWISILALHMFLTRTNLGTSIRAISGNVELARARGIDIKTTTLAVWFVASALAALAGVMVALVGGINIELGWHYILIVLAVSVVSGLRSLYAVLFGAMLFGLIIELSALVVPSKYALIIAFALIIVTLLIRPEGLASVGRRKEANA